VALPFLFYTFATGFVQEIKKREGPFVPNWAINKSSGHPPCYHRLTLIGTHAPCGVIDKDKREDVNPTQEGVDNEDESDDENGYSPLCPEWITTKCGVKVFV
jgi:hypothetical protein